MTDKAFILRCLRDGRPWTLNDLLRASFAERGCGLTVHSRISDLRKDGYVIAWWQQPGEKRGNGSVYQLVGPLESSEDRGVRARTGSLVSSGAGADGNEPTVPPRVETAPLTVTGEEPRVHGTATYAPTVDDSDAGSRVAVSSSPAQLALVDEAFQRRVA